MHETQPHFLTQPHFPTDPSPKATLMNRLAMKASFRMVALFIALIIPLITIDAQADDIGNVEVELPKPFVEDNAPIFDPINDPINNGAYFSTFLTRGSELIKHPDISGGVIISSDGLVLTNHHVIDRGDSGIKGMLVMTHDGCAYPIVEVLAGSRRSDVALIRIKADRPSAEPVLRFDAGRCQSPC